MRFGNGVFAADRQPRDDGKEGGAVVCELHETRAVVC